MYNMLSSRRAMETVTKTSFLWYLDCWRESHHSCRYSPMVRSMPGILSSLIPILIFLL